MTGLLLALIAGTLTTLSPCVLPVLPIVLIGALQRHRLAPLALVSGMTAMFAFTGTVLASAGGAVGGNVLRNVSGILMVAFGMVLMSARAQRLLANATAPLAGRLGDATSRFRPDGLAGHTMLGALLGAVWTPCSGPTLGAAMGLAAARDNLSGAATVMLVFGLGAGLPMLVLAYGSRQALKARRDRLAGVAALSKPLLGAILLALGTAVVFGLDHVAESWLVATMPDWMLELSTRF